MSRRERDRLAVALAGREDVLGSSTPHLVWQWERRGSRWVSTLKDGTVLVVALQRFGRRSFWNASIDGVMLPANGHPNPDAAQKYALDVWKARQEFYAPEEDT